MKKLPWAFLALAVVYVIVGMVYGIYMAATANHATSPAHGHLNLMGFVMGMLFAFYYHLVPSAQTRAGWIHFGIHQVSVITMFPAVILAHSDGSEEPAKIAAIIAVVAMLVFGYVIYNNRAEAQPE